MLLGRHRRPRLLRDPRLLAQVHLGLQDLHHLQHNRRRQTPPRLTARALAPLRRINQVFRPAVEIVRPVLGLRDRQPLVLQQVVGEGSQLPHHVGLPHLFEDRPEIRQSPAVVVRLQVVHDDRHILAPPSLHLRQFLQWATALQVSPSAKVLRHLPPQLRRHVVLQARRRLQPLDQRAPLEVRQHAVHFLRQLLKLGQQVPLLFDRLLKRRVRPVLVGLVRLGWLSPRQCRGWQPQGRRARRLLLSRIARPSRRLGLLRTLAVRHRGCRGTIGLWLRRLTRAPLGVAVLPHLRSRLRGIRRQRLAGLCRLLQQVGDARHPVRRDVLQHLQHLGPLFQVPDPQFGIAGRLPQQVFSRRGECRKSPAIRPLGGRLRLQPPERVGLPQVGVRQ